MSSREAYAVLPGPVLRVKMPLPSGELILIKNIGHGLGTVVTVGVLAPHYHVGEGGTSAADPGGVTDVGEEITVLSTMAKLSSSRTPSRPIVMEACPVAVDDVPGDVAGSGPWPLPWRSREGRPQRLSTPNSLGEGYQEGLALRWPGMPRPRMQR